MDLVSIVVPIFNSEVYIERCISSIVKQTYKNLEIILINDGSTDNSLNLCNTFIDRRIKIISQSNKGVSVARNKGLQNANGKYVSFIDSDDFVSTEFISNLVTLIKIKDENQKEMGISICSVGINELVEKKEVIHEYNNIKLLDCCIDRKGSMQGYSCNKLFNLNIIKNNKIAFDPEIKIFEDLLFCTNYISCIKNGIFTNLELYCYLKENTNSATQKFNPERYTSIIAYEKILDSYYFKQNKTLKENAQSNYFLVMIYYYKIYYKSISKEKSKLIKSKLIKNRKLLLLKQIPFKLKVYYFIIIFNKEFMFKIKRKKR